jgi:hypothetical protein
VLNYECGLLQRNTFACCCAHTAGMADWAGPERTRQQKALPADDRIATSLAGHHRISLGATFKHARCATRHLLFGTRCSACDSATVCWHICTWLKRRRLSSTREAHGTLAPNYVAGAPDTASSVGPAGPFSAVPVAAATALAASAPPASLLFTTPWTAGANKRVNPATSTVV